MIPIDTIKGIANRYLSAVSITRNVTYRSISVSYSKTTMKTTETRTDISTKALVSRVGYMEHGISAAVLMDAKKKFMIRADALANVRPSTKDRIYVEGRWWEIIKVRRIRAASAMIAYVFYGK
jgi:hypothetical protein